MESPNKSSKITSLSPSTPSSARPNATSFSPITVAASPSSKIGQRGNLTGLPRTVRDAVADLYNQVQRWNKQHTEGCLVLSKLADIKKSQFGQGDQDTTVAKLQKLCDLLESCCDNLTDISEDMKRISKELEAVYRLEEFKSNTASPLFLTWPTSLFASFAQELAAAYEAELQVKRLILSRVALTKNESDMSFFVASWVHQPSLPSHVLDLRMEAALVETGLH